MTERSTAGPGRGLGFTVVTCAVVALTAGLALRASRPPAPLPASVADDRFSAERAMAHVDVLARAPRPLGTEAHRAAQEYLEAQLESLGLETEVQETTWVRGFAPGRQTAARVRNVLGRLPGAGTGDVDTLLLMAHYDSQPQTFGAGDDAAGVAAILELLRARSLDGPARNEIVVAFTDAEEVGLIGAEAFAALHPWFERVDRTLNFEGRGQRGPALMFETAEGGVDSARDLARHAPYPAASSMSYEVYRRMPNDTDFSVIKRAGGHGLNFAFIGGLPAYHSMLDTARRLDRGTLQHLGSNALALTRHYASVALGPVPAAEGVYFNLLGLGPLWVLSAGTARAVALAALALAVGACWISRSRGEGRLAGVPLAWGLVLLGAVLTMIFVWGLLRLLGGAPATPYGVPYAEGTTALGLVLVALGAWGLALGFWRGAVRELLAALALLWSLLGVLVAWWVVGLSHLLVVPALSLGVGVMLACLLEPRYRWLPALVALVPGVLLWAPALELSHQALTIRAALPLAGLALFAATLLTPAFCGLGVSVLRRVAAVALLAGAGLLGWALVGQDASADRPRVDSLFLLHQSGEEAGAEGATWFSLDPEVDPWSEQALGSQPDRRPLPEVLDRRRRELLAAPAAGVPPAASLTVTRERDDRPGGGRSVALRLRSSAESLRLWAHANVALSGASIDGRPCDLDENGELRLSVHGTAPEGYLLEVTLDDRWPLYLEVVEVHYGLPPGIEPRPAERIPRPGWWTDTTMIHSSSTL